jgi:hypothetical protein
MEYLQYESYIESILKENDLSKFKSNPAYNDILEHVSPQYGYHYLTILRQGFHVPDSLIKMFGTMNDAIGNPHTFTFDNDISISPTSLRYICHALLILSHVKESGKQDVKFVEIGCGYGGLTCALSFFASFMGIQIKEFHLIDLEAPLKLQQKYLEKFKLDVPVFFHKAEFFGEDLSGSDYFLISNYCFSEISHEYQRRYLQALFPKCTHGFLTWNHIDVYNIGKQVTVEDEYPLTGAKNKYVRF